MRLLEIVSSVYHRGPYTDELSCTYVGFAETIEIPQLRRLGAGRAPLFTPANKQQKTDAEAVLEHL